MCDLGSDVVSAQQGRSVTPDLDLLPETNARGQIRRAEVVPAMRAKEQRRERKREGNVMPEATTTRVRVQSAAEETSGGEVAQWPTLFPWHNEQV